MKITRFIAITCIFVILLSIVGYNVSAKETDGVFAPLGCENCDLGKSIDALILADSYVIGNVITSDDINVKDATAIQKHIADVITLSESSLLLADTNGDNVINVKDATVIQKYIAGIFVAPCYIGNSPYQEPEGIKIGDNIYLVAEGDIITYQVSLQADKLFENIQAVVNYDSDVLELIRLIPDDPDDAVWVYEGEYRCPNLDMVIFNADINNKVKFNSSKILGYNFKDEKVLITLDFKVKSTKYSEIDFVMEFMTIKGDGDEHYFFEGDTVITDGITLKEYLDIPCYRNN